MNGNPVVRVLLLCSTVAIVCACGGAGGGAPMASGIEGSGVAPRGITSAGVITELGSIFVNGVEYDLTGATITIDGYPAGESDLDVGGIVIVEGTLDTFGTTGKATRVTAGIAVAGPISAVNLALNQITVLGQTVEIDAATLIEPGSAEQPLGGLAVNDDVEVSGFANSAGLVTARRIAPRPASSPLKVIGFVTNLDTATKRFTINDQLVDYAAATLVGLDATQLSGAPVRVTASEPADAGAALKAEQVVFRDLRLPGATGDLAALQGWVTEFTSESEFAVDGHPVVTTPVTKVEGPKDEYLGHVRLDAFVSVEGKLISGGVVEATLVEINDVVAMDTVITDLGTDGFVSAALIPWARQGCQIGSDTGIVVDGLSATFGDLDDGDVATIHVHLEGQEGQEGEVYRDARCWIIDVQHNVRGPVESLATDSASMMVMGQRVWFDTAYEGFVGLDNLQIGDMVEVSGHTTAAGDILATGIHAASSRPGYQVIGLVRNVDADADRFTLGELLIDYADAAVAGFPGDGPAEGERVLVVAASAPADGLLHADVVKYTVPIPRGAAYNFLMPFGLITRYAAPDDLDVEGRRVIRMEHQVGSDPTDPGWTWGFCDVDKLHADLRATFFSVGGPLGRPLYWTAQCPSGRRRDALGGNDANHWAPLVVAGLVESVDLVNRSVTVIGVKLMLHPATLLTRFASSSDPDASGGTSTPAFLEELTVGERARVRVAGHPTDGIRTVDDIWLDDAVMAQPDNYIEADLESVAEPDVMLYGGVRVRVTADTDIQSGGCESTTFEPAEFFANAPTGSHLFMPVVRNGDQLVAQSIYWDPGCWDY